MIVDIENKKIESEALTDLLNKSINKAAESSKTIYDIAKNLSDGLIEDNKTSEHTMASIINRHQSAKQKKPLMQFPKHHRRLQQFQRKKTQP
ncbi:hypothetical protein [Ruminiclostridium papyrosolvens]|uniref:Uncharacterized protein n=1 Tax=Ruminiclostridium papyrosolvens C7 TaxID=1330534 RepID=U4QYC9_9FIRM|nr:hypothetical protein [Ruminiclostridium papyrosolvens]EPR09599.1 hypothetical protein L323_15580 [Ruminiclostridium papyrosolvens C7]